MNLHKQPTWGDMVVIDAALTNAIDEDVVGSIVGLFEFPDGRISCTVETKDGTTVEVNVSAVKVLDDDQS